LSVKELKSCEICGRLFWPKTAWQKMCSPFCRAVKKADTASKWNKSHPNGPTDPICTICGKPVEGPDQRKKTRPFTKHASCVYEDCKKTILKGEKLTSAQYQNLNAIGYTIRQLKKEILMKDGEN